MYPAVAKVTCLAYSTLIKSALFCMSLQTTGAAVFISAPGGDFESASGNIVAKPGGGCVSQRTTSLATTWQ